MKVVLEKYQKMMSNRTSVLMAVLLLLGLGLRLLDLTDPPLDFHPTRQYRGALIARSIYYDMLPDADPERRELASEMRSDFPEFEPPLLETVVALGYILLGSEQLWLARLIVSLFWVLGGWGLYLLVKRTVSAESALVSLAYYLFLPFAVYASRSFQPDPLMTVAIIFTTYSAMRWAEEQNWKWAILTASCAVLAVIAKVVAAYMIAGLMFAVVLHIGLRRAMRQPQVWMMAAIMFILPGSYYFLSIGESSSNYFQNWMVALMPLVLERSFYVGWLRRLYSFNRLALLAALAGFALSRRGLGRKMLIGLLVGYVVYGFTLPHQTMTHNYYHIQFTPVVAWCLAYAVQWMLDQLGGYDKQLPVLGLSALLLASLLPAAVAAHTLLKEDHRHEPGYWVYIAEQVPEDGQTIGLVQQYGHLLMYYGWKEVALWPPSGELYLAELRGNPNVEDFPAFFKHKTEGMDYFLITSFNQFERQEELYDHLYASYQIHAEGQGYLVFDLQ